MQDIEQNMDDLFRKAAEDYPLKAGDSRWDDIAPLLNKPTTITAKKTAYKKYIGLLVIFLPLLLNDGILINNILQTNKAISSFQPPIENKIYTPIITKDARAHDNNKKTTVNSSSLKYLSAKASIPLTTLTLSNTKKDKLSSRLSPAYPGSNTELITSNILFSTNNQELPSIDINAIPSLNTASPKENQEKQETSSEKKQQGLSRKSGFYLGAMAGPLFDEIKNQGLKKTGFSTGIIAGYQFKNHLSFETGFFFAKKPYFSVGKYFKLDKIGNSMPQGMEILSLEGCNFAWEIPAKIKYDFLHNTKRNFFSSAGITSYIMTHEKNNYLVFMNGAQQTMISSYKNKSRSLAATLDISAGYEHKISRTNYIRIEPYLQIPLKGMGVGSMQMMSSGLRIGITKFIN